MEQKAPVWNPQTEQSLKCNAILASIDLYSRQTTQLSNQIHAFSQLPADTKEIIKGLQKTIDHIDQEMAKTGPQASTDPSVLESRTTQMPHYDHRPWKESYGTTHHLHGWIYEDQQPLTAHCLSRPCAKGIFKWFVHQGKKRHM